MRIQSIAAAYHAAPITTPRAIEGYVLLAEYALTRFVQAIAAGWTFEPTAIATLPDLDLAKRTLILEVYDREHNHPVLTDRDNFRVRATHDVFGHIPSGGSFTVAGEIRAARHQALDVKAYGARVGWTETQTQLAISAMLGDVIGQTACFAADGRFPIQKAFLLLGTI